VVAATSFASTSTTTAGEAGDDDVEEGDDAVDDRHEDCADTVDDGHEDPANGLAEAGQLEVDCQLSNADDVGVRRR